ncbi:protein kinase [Kutzneria kofuensis]|uniref:non-specific serine/threonine protein kinase n=1 Tax=Kutzneria kofuensis TaxID=103725 RepID=A0A7W9KM95_9PSEU|nr:serine/threonine-protein kinase [Kutzneria kofuensis]MBB5895062.1 serine/threonine protein kinase [Kutzneria kofuensis]
MTVDGRVVAGRYRLGRRIGSGAMGVVWQAHDELLYRTVAVKQLLLQPGQTEADAEEARRRAMREGRIAARLQHPNAVAVFDVVDEGDGMPWLVMEYVPSRSLSAVLEEQGTLPPQEAARIGMHVASALAAAHAAGIVHRDVKPGNVLLGDDGTVKITDFGISRAQGDSTVTATGMLAGTPAYLAPEIAKGHDPTPSSDVFSLGATLYAAVEGVPPFGLSDNPLALLHKVASGQIEPPRQAGPLTQPLLSLLSSEPTERVTMVRCRDALGAVAAGQPAPPMPIPQQAHMPTVATNAQRPAPMATRVEQRPVGGPSRSTSTTALPPVRPKGQQQSGGMNRGALIGIVAAVVVAVIVGVIVVSNQMTGNRPDNQGGGGNAQAGGSTSTTTNAPAVTSISRQPVTSSPDESVQQQTITDFYAQLPNNAQNAAAAYLSPDFIGGADSFVSQMSGLKSVTLDNIRPGDFFFQADEHLVSKDGTKTVQPVGIGLKWAGSQLYINKVQNLGAAKPES